MTKPLYSHQKKVVDADPKRIPIALGVGGGKTRLALELAKEPILIIAPKQQIMDKTWDNCFREFGIQKSYLAVSKEQFKRDWSNYRHRYNTLIVDEAHHMLGMYPETKQKNKVAVPKTSGLFDSLRFFIERWNPERIYLVSATPISKPMNLLAMAKILGHNWDFYKFRDTFYFQKNIGGRLVWLVKKDNISKERLLTALKRLQPVTGQLDDWFDVPEQIEIIKHFELTTEQKKAIKDEELSNADPLALIAKKRQIENGIRYGFNSIEKDEKTTQIVSDTKFYDCDKNEYIKEIAMSVKKCLLFVNWKGQIQMIKDMLESEGYTVFTLTGDTKNRKDIVATVEKTPECILIAQSSISEGYEVPSISHVIFVSKSHKYRDIVQGKGRVLRANAIKKNIYIHLVVKGGEDEKCHKTIMSGMDFQERMYDET